jgi:hypothetical protein
VPERENSKQGFNTDYTEKQVKPRIAQRRKVDDEAPHGPSDWEAKNTSYASALDGPGGGICRQLSFSVKSVA